MHVLWGDRADLGAKATALSELLQAGRRNGCSCRHPAWIAVRPRLDQASGNGREVWLADSHKGNGTKYITGTKWCCCPTHRFRGSPRSPGCKEYHIGHAMSLIH